MKNLFLTLLFVFGLFSNLAGQSYLGYVTKSVNFRTQPNTNCKIIESLDRGTPLFVISNQKINGFYSVINIDTNVEGFVHSNFVLLDKLLPKNEKGIFTPTGRTSQSSPVIKIHNNTDLGLTLKLNANIYKFIPQERKEIVLPPGTYEYRASAPGVLPDYGNEIMQSNYENSWSFYIATVRN